MKYLKENKWVLVYTLVVVVFSGCDKNKEIIIRYSNGIMKYHESHAGSYKKVVEFYENGKTKSHTEYRDNLELLHYEWSTNGYLHMKRVTSYRSKSEKGSKKTSIYSRTEETYLHIDSIYRRYTNYYENGKKKEERDYNQFSQLNGWYFWWSENCELLKKQKYKKGLPIDDTISIMQIKPSIENTSDVPKISEYTCRWRVRGKTATTWLYGVKSVDRIHLTPIEGMFDTIYFQRMLAVDTSEWYSLWTRISVEGDYEAYVGPCCGRFHVMPSKDINTVIDDVWFKMNSSDGKMYLARIGENGVILKDGEEVHLNRACHAFLVSGNESIHREIAIEEIDTSEATWKRGSDHLNENDTNSGSGDSIRLKDLVCINNMDCESTSECMLTYCCIRTIIEVTFIWLDDKPLFVEFDADKQKVTLR